MFDLSLTRFGLRPPQLQAVRSASKTPGWSARALKPSISQRIDETGFSMSHKTSAGSSSMIKRIAAYSTLATSTLILSVSFSLGKPSGNLMLLSGLGVCVESLIGISRAFVTVSSGGENVTKTLSHLCTISEIFDNS